MSLLIVVFAVSGLTGCSASSTGTDPASLPSALSHQTVEDPRVRLESTHTTRRTTASVSKNKPTPSDIDRFISSSQQGIDAYRIGRSDIIDVSVFKVPELSGERAVNEFGFVNMPVIGAVDVAGKTAHEVEQALNAKLGARYLQKPQVNVRVTQMNSQRVTIDGAVKKPGLYPVTGGLTLLQAIAMAEGLTDTASTTVVILRDKRDRRTAARFDLDKIRAGASSDPRLFGGDIIIARESSGRLFLDSIVKILPFATVFTVI